MGEWVFCEFLGLLFSEYFGKHGLNKRRDFVEIRMAFLRNLYLIPLAYITSEITQAILVSHLSTVVTIYALLEPTPALGQKLAIHRTWHTKQLHAIRSFSYQTTIGRNDLVETH